MKIIYNPFYTGNVYISQNLWDVVTVGDAGLLEQLLMRAGLPRTVADADDEKKDVRIDTYKQALEALGETIFSKSLKSDDEGTVKQLLKWRDLLVLVGWTAEKTMNADSDKLRVFAACDGALKDYPSRADRWYEVYQYLKDGHKILKDTDAIKVQVPKVLIPSLITNVLELLPNVTYSMETLDSALKPEGHQCSIITPQEQYEAWQLLVKLPYDAQTMLVCADEKRLNDTMQAIGGEQWQTTRVGCPHPATTVFDQMDVPNRLVWMDCAGDGLTVNPYDFLSAADIQELTRIGVRILDAETRSATEMQWIYTLFNRIPEWILVAPKYHMGEALGEHPVITSLQQHKNLFDQSCDKGKFYTLPQKIGGKVITFEPTGNISIDPKALKEHTISPSDSATTIETLVNVPLDYVLEKLGGLAAPEDDKEANENLMKGPIAHKVVELLINDQDSERARPLKQIQKLFEEDYFGFFEKAMTDEEVIQEAAFLKKDENANMLAVFKEELRQSVARLLEIMAEKQLSPIRCEYEVTTPFKPFDNPHGFVDMLLEDKNRNLVIIDLKWSERKEYQDRIEKGEAYQLYMYKHAAEAQLKRPVAWYAYYIFPKMELFTEPDDVEPKWNEWLAERETRLEQLAEGTIAQTDPKKDEYPVHLILKNLNIK